MTASLGLACRGCSWRGDPNDGCRRANGNGPNNSRGSLRHGGKRIMTFVNDEQHSPQKKPAKLGGGTAELDGRWATVRTVQPPTRPELLLAA